MYFIDTNIFLEIELKESRSEQCKEFLKRVLNGEIQAFTSDFNLDSVVVIMDAKRCRAKPISKFLLNIMTFEGLTIYSLNMVDRIVATKYMQKYGLTFDDAITYFVAKSLDIKELISFDPHFDGLPEIKRLEPKDAIK